LTKERIFASVAGFFSPSCKTISDPYADDTGTSLIRICSAEWKPGSRFDGKTGLGEYCSIDK
jgi:hypothetical protein